MKIFTIFLILVVFNFSLYSNEEEDTLRGVVLERISQFITYKTIDDTFNICVYDDNDILNTFKNLYLGRKYRSKPIKTLEIKSTKEIHKCHVLYTCDLDTKDTKNILNKSQNQVLLVSQNIDDINKGFMVAIYFENKKIKFALNHKAIQNADLKVSYRLLKVASRVINPVSNK